MNDQVTISKSALTELMNALRGGGATEERTFKEKIANKKRATEIFSLSPSELDRLIREGVLVEGKHFTRYNDNGHKRFDIEECYKALKPERAGA
jgi:hypothetical protein